MKALYYPYNYIGCCFYVIKFPVGYFAWGTISFFHSCTYYIQCKLVLARATTRCTLSFQLVCLSYSDTHLFTLNHLYVFYQPKYTFIAFVYFLSFIISTADYSSTYDGTSNGFYLLHLTWYLQFQFYSRVLTVKFYSLQRYTTIQIFFISQTMF